MARLGPVKVEAAQEGLRFDKALSELCGISRGRARAIIDAGGAYLNRKRFKRASHAVALGNRLECWDDAPERAAHAVPEPLVRLEQPGFCVIYKPAGLPSQPTAQTDRVDLLAQLPRRFKNVHLLHRLDRNASGLLLLAIGKRHRKALVAALNGGTLRREYLVRVAGAPAEDAGTLEHHIEGQLMRSHFRVRDREPSSALLEIRLETGRTHQIRKQCAAEGHPVLGDPRYGGPPGQRLALHAFRLSFPHPGGAKEVVVEEPLPEDF